MPIPWKAVEEFDLRHYKVSQIAFQQIEKLYDLPILEIPYDSAIVKSSKTLFEFLVKIIYALKVLKRQIHLLYDMICDPSLV